MKTKNYLLILLGWVAFSASAQTNFKSTHKAFLRPKSKMVLVTAHRAVHHEYPENSIPAIEEAIRLGVDIAEIDVKVSSDGIPFLMHDRTINRTTNGKGDPEEMTFADLQKLNLVANGKVTNLKIPSLEEVLKVAKGKILLDFDMKTDRVEEVVQVVNKSKAWKSVLFFDSEYEVLKKVRSANSKAYIMPPASSLADADSVIRTFQPRVVHIDFDFYTPEGTSLIKNNKARVWINALGEPDKWIREGKTEEALDKLLKNGANIIQTDEPEKLIAALKARKLR